VDGEETYEPNLISLEIAQKLDMEREEYLERQEESVEDLSVFTLTEEKGFEKFKELYGTSEDEEGELVNNFQRFNESVFSCKGCNRHRNSLELFSFN